MALLMTALLVCFGFVLVRTLHPRGRRRPWMVTLILALLIAAVAVVLHVVPYLALIPMVVGGVVAEWMPSSPGRP